MTTYQEKRIEKLQKILEKINLDAMVVYNGFNTRYLLDFTGGTGDGVLVVGKNSARFITDARYEEDYKNRLPKQVSFKVTRQYFGEAINYIKDMGYKEVGFESDLPFAIWDNLDENLPEKVNFQPVPELIETIREVKDEYEIEQLKKANEISIKAFNDLLPFIKAGVTEREVCNELDRLAKLYGAEKISFDTIVASGYRSALPHGEATDKVIEEGELVTIDFGYYYNGYTSDITRTVAVGKLDDKLKDVYETVKVAKDLTIKAMKAGVAANEIDKVARDYIESKGYGQYFEHATGHGAGLDIHETPVLAARVSDPIQKNNLLTVEPGIYLPGIGGVRIEDDILVTDDGYINFTEELTSELIEL